MTSQMTVRCLPGLMISAQRASSNNNNRGGSNSPANIKSEQGRSSTPHKGDHKEKAAARSPSPLGDGGAQSPLPHSPQSTGEEQLNR